MQLLPEASLFPRGRDHFRDWAGLDAGSLPPVLAELARRQDGLITVITPGPGEARQLMASLQFYLAGDEVPVLEFPDRETLPWDLFSPHQDIISERIRTLHRLPRMESGILVTPVSTLMQKLPPRAHIEGNAFLMRTGEPLDVSATRTRLHDAGYQERDTVREHGEFAVRGAILDIFPMGAEQPFRIELFDDEIESLRLFDPESQRSVARTDEIRLLPAAEYPLDDTGIARFRSSFRERFDVDPRQCPIYQEVSEGIAAPGLEYYLPLFFETLATLFDYLPDNTRLVETAGVDEAATLFDDEVRERHESRRHDLRRPVTDPTDIFLTPDDLRGQLRSRTRARLRESEQALRFALDTRPELSTDPRSGNPFGPLQAFAAEHPELAILICAETAGRREVLLELMQKQGIQPALVADWQAFRDRGAGWHLTVGELEKGFLSLEEDVLVVGEPELYGQRIMQRRRRQESRDDSSELAFRSLGEMTPGTPVVHIDHGVGRYQGLTHMTVDGQQHEFLLLEYADNDRLYVPVSSLHLISRYGGAHPDNAPLDRLGSDQWARARRRAAEKVRDVAAELLNTMARRESRKGRAFGLERDEYRRFASGFPFEETADQEKTIRSVLEDLQSDQPMDRLVCGDVGFGKTEVAMRAAFVAVQNNTQVAVLVPTTLLAQQHFDSFSDRFADWPVEIEMLSRFRTAAERRRVLERLEEGKVDIVIGTHQLLQERMPFRDLGLVIVDEEHRFGVRHKERLKELRAEADILTLTATPIPRTLNMAFSGLRDISIIATAPDRRLSVKTFVQRREDAVIREAILRELLRGGQVYFLHNDIDTMAQREREIRELVPEARVAIAHGQMRERELEAVMSDFYHRRFNVLLCTTIIETGIDIPSANTIIIERADRFGLAQLHQLRGRVGRSHHQAYAYLLTPPPKAMTRDAQRRLEAIENASDLGAGFVLASQDLEIRGAGELLGEEQHGHMETIGFTLYMEMLEQTVEALRRGEQPDTETPLSGGPEINLRVPALIPEDYLPDVYTRLTLYKRITACETQQALDDMKVEMIDRFGMLPRQVKNLFHVTALRQRAEALGIERIDAGASGGRIDFSPRTQVDPLQVVHLVQSAPQRFALEGSTRLRFRQDAESEEERFEVVEQLLAELAAGQKEQAAS